MFTIIIDFKLFEKLKAGSCMQPERTLWLYSGRTKLKLCSGSLKALVFYTHFRAIIFLTWWKKCTTTLEPLAFMVLEKNWKQEKKRITVNDWVLTSLHLQDTTSSGLGVGWWKLIKWETFYFLFYKQNNAVSNLRRYVLYSVHTSKFNK